MKRLLPLLTLVLVSAFFTKASAQTADQSPPVWTSIVMVDDLLGIMATNPGVNPMKQIRILNAAGAVVYQDGNTAPDYEEVNMSSAPVGSYTVQIRLQVGWESHNFQVQ